jgi:hypothetical protein
MSLLQRYLAGEHEPVWAELVRRDMNDDSSRHEAISVAKETVDRAVHNLRLLHSRLVELGFEFERPGHAFVEADDRSRRLIQEVETLLGELPILASAWYERIASVDFSQSARQCRELPDHPLGNLGWYPHMIYQPLDECLERSREFDREYKEWYETSHEFWESKGYDLKPPDKTFLPIGGCATNHESKGFALPNPGADGVLFDDGGGPKYFHDDIRLGFRFGGFPRLNPKLRRILPDVTRTRHPEPDKLLSILVEGLSPL